MKGRNDRESPESERGMKYKEEIREAGRIIEMGRGAERKGGNKSKRSMKGERTDQGRGKR